MNTAYSPFIPDDFIASVANYLPAHLNMDDFLAACRRPLRKSIRVNTLKMSVDDFKEEAKARDWQLSQVPWCETGFWLTRPEDEENALPLGSTDLLLAGCIYIQEASSMVPPELLFDDNDFDCVLDMASAPGSKTSQIAAHMQNQGVLVANEFSSSRLKVLAATLQRLGVRNCATSHFDAAIFGSYMPERFSHILLDAPCSGEGTVRKDPDALKNWSIESCEAISDVQKSLIESAFYALKTGGRLVYSTCTLSPIENQAVCEHLLNTFKDKVKIVPITSDFAAANDIVTAEGYMQVWPQVLDSEGFFIACFEKVEHQIPPVEKVKKGAFPFTPISKKANDYLHALIKKQFGITSLPGTLMQRDKDLWLFPEGFSEIKDAIKYSRIGIHIATEFNKGVKLSHEFGVNFSHLAVKNTLLMTNEQATAYFQGKDFKMTPDQAAEGEVIVTLCGTGVGIAKALKGKVKNQLPRHLVRDKQLITW